jgi:hypothetical protein
MTMSAYTIFFGAGMVLGLATVFVDIAFDNPLWQLPVPGFVVPGCLAAAVCLVVAADIQPDGATLPAWALRVGAVVLVWSGWHRFWWVTA